MRFCQSVLFAILLLASSGCVAAVAAGAVGAIYVNGALEADVDGTPEQVTAAAEQACNDLKLRHISSESTSLDGAVRASTADDTDVRIDIEPSSERTSEVAIRVGTFGDEKLSLKILDAIKARL